VNINPGQGVNKKNIRKKCLKGDKEIKKFVLMCTNQSAQNGVRKIKVRRLVCADQCAEISVRKSLCAN
ncbi:hypothetical protein PJP12_29985, partial [Mycobacterium kansasii]